MKRWLMIVVIAMTVAVLGVVVLAATTKPPKLPEGAISLALRTYPAGWQAPWLPRTCPLGLLPPVKMVHEGQTVVFDRLDGGERVPVVFPTGFQAWSVAGKAQLVTPEGDVLAREGDVLVGLIGSAADNGDLNVCFTSPAKYQVVVRRGS